MTSRLSAVFLSLILAVSPIAFAQQAPTTKGGSAQPPAQAQAESPSAAIAGAEGAINPAIIIGIAAAIAVAVAVSSDGTDELIPPAPTGTTATGTQ